MQIRPLTRLTNEFSKRIKGLKAALSLTLYWYNFVRLHSSIGMTPAMPAGIADRFWTSNDHIPN